MRAAVIAICILLLPLVGTAQQATIRVAVRANALPVADAEVVISGKTYRTDSQGTVTISVPPGRIELTIVKSGYVPGSVDVDVRSNEEQPVIVDLVREITVEEHVTVSATRTDRGIEDQPMRVEVVDEVQGVDHSSSPQAMTRSG